MNQSFKVLDGKTKCFNKKKIHKKKIDEVFCPIVLEAVFNKINCQSQKIVVVLHKKK
jgi:hypothetical protein